MPRPSSPRGMTLVELLVAGTVASFVLLGVSLVFISQTRQYGEHTGLRSAQANARQGLDFLEHHVRRAGYGVDPALAILAFESYDAAADAQGTDYPDALVVHARDLTFRRTITAIDSGALTVDFSPPLSEPLFPGQILLLLCADGQTWRYVTLGQRAQADATQVQLAGAGAAPAEGPLSLPGARFRQEGSLNVPCLTGAGAQLVKVERSSFFVAAFDDDQDDGSPAVPYLMYARGLDLNGDGAVTLEDASPVATGIEQLQVAYILNSTDDAPPLLVGVDDEGPPWGDAWAASVVGPKLDDPYVRPASEGGQDPRLTNHPANIRQVRLTVVGRSSQRDPNRTGDDLSEAQAGEELANGQTPWQGLENLSFPVGGGDAAAQPFSPSGRGYMRVVLRLSVAPKNLLMRSQFAAFLPGGG